MYDGWGQAIQEINEHGGQVNIAYDNMGRMTSRTNPFQAGGTPAPATTYQYDTLGRGTLITTPDNHTVTTAYNGKATTLTDPVNRKIKREVDSLGRLIKVTEQEVATGNLTQETTYTYDLADRLTQVNQGNQLRAFKYDAAGRLLDERIPEQAATIWDGGAGMWSTCYTYTDFGAVATKMDARGAITNYSYDPLNRLTQISYTVPTGVAATPTVTYTYDNNQASTTKGLLLSITVGSSYTESYSYDSYKRVSAITYTIDSKNYTVGYQYNQADQGTQLTFPSGRKLNLNHDSVGRLLSLVNNADSSNYLSGLTYNYSGFRTGWTLGNGVVETFTHDTNRVFLASQTATKNGNTLLSLAYSYQAAAGQNGAGSTAGNAHQMISLTGSIGGFTESASYTYDLQKRLVTASQTTNNTSVQRRFVYDRWGNRAQVYDATSGGNLIQSVAFQQSGGAPTNQIASVTQGSTTWNYVYDNAGNITSDGINSFVYDAENRIVSRNSGSETFAFDQNHQRIKKAINGGATTHYIWEGSRVIAEHNGSSGAVNVEYIYFGNKLIAKEQSGRFYFLNDKLSIRALLNSSGSVVGRQGHLPFGEEIAASGTQDKHHFTSYESDSESTTDYAVNRQYAQSTGRFLSADPYQTSEHLTNPQSWNRYAYVVNDPIHNTDSLGLYAEGPGHEMICSCFGGFCYDPSPDVNVGLYFKKVKYLDREWDFVYDNVNLDFRSTPRTCDGQQFALTISIGFLHEDLTKINWKVVIPASGDFNILDYEILPGTAPAFRLSLRRARREQDHSRVQITITGTVRRVLEPDAPFSGRGSVNIRCGRD